MKALDREKLAPLVDRVMASAGDSIAQGLNDENAHWALAAHKQTILPYRLRLAQEASPREQAATVAQVAAELRAELAPLDPSQRMQAIVVAYYWTVLAPFSEAAFDLARRLVERAGEREGLQGEAKTTLRAVNAFIARVGQESPAALAALRSELSETLLDCRHVLNETPYISRRLNRYLDHLAAKPRPCPNCGSATRKRSKFCPECGTKLVS